MTTKRFTADIYAGHTTDFGVLVPFDPSKTWKTAMPLPIDYRKHVGDAVRGTVEGVPFESWLFHYFHQWRIVVPAAAMAGAKDEVGETGRFAVRPHPKPEVAPKFKPGPKR